MNLFITPEDIMSVLYPNLCASEVYVIMSITHSDLLTFQDFFHAKYFSMSSKSARIRLLAQNAVLNQGSAKFMFKIAWQ